MSNSTFTRRREEHGRPRLTLWLRSMVDDNAQGAPRLGAYRIKMTHLLVNMVLTTLFLKKWTGDGPAGRDITRIRTKLVRSQRRFGSPYSPMILTRTRLGRLPSNSP